MPQPHLVWLPAEPVSGGASMLRWWSSLAAEAERHGGYRISCPLGPPPEATSAPAAGRWQRAFQKYIHYPAQVRRLRTGDLYHLLDHSWAHLLRHVPAGIPRLATVHDLIPLRFPDGLTTSQLKRWRSVVMELGRCDCIIADSAYTKAEITALLGIAADRIEVVPLGVDLRERAMVPPTRVTEAVTRMRQQGVDLVVGCLGSGIGRKNLQIVPKAAALLEEAGCKVGVVRAGPGLPPGLAECFSGLEQAGRFADLGFITNTQVDEFYGAIDVQVMPSLYEGFGLPVLEAMAAGTAVVCSEATSLPEVAGDAALLFDPLRPESLSAQLGKLRDVSARAVWAARGLARAQQFSWTETWRQYDAIYRRLLQR